MNKLKLKWLLHKYRKEIIDGEYTHVRDLIAILIINDLSHDFPIDKYYNFNAIDLGWLLNDSSCEYRIPSLEVLNFLTLEYENRYKENKSLYGTYKYLVAINWIKLMLNFNLINEGEIINPINYKLADFINDEKLIKMFKDNGLKYVSYDEKLRRILKRD